MIISLIVFASCQKVEKVKNKLKVLNNKLNPIKKAKDRRNNKKRQAFIAKSLTNELHLMEELTCEPNPKEALEIWGNSFKETTLQEKWAYYQFDKDCACPGVKAFTHYKPLYINYATCCILYPKFCQRKDHGQAWEWIDSLYRDLGPNGQCRTLRFWNERSSYQPFNTKKKKGDLLYGSGQLPEELTEVGSIVLPQQMKSFSFDEDSQMYRGDRNTGLYKFKILVIEDIPGAFVSTCSATKDESEFVTLPGYCLEVTQAPKHVGDIINFVTIRCPDDRRRVHKFH